MNVVWLCGFWISWCAMHSILIDVSVIGFIKTHAIGLTRYYRLLYNGFSLITLIPLIIITRMAEGQVIFKWEGYGVPVRAFMLVVAFLLFKGGAQKYDLRYFLGVKQLQTGTDHLLMSDKEAFVESGVLGVTRHPWYLGSLCFIWSMLAEYPLPVFLAVCIMSIYLVVGSLLEERKILAQYGDEYRCYRQRVSMFFPWQWLVRFLRRSL